MRVSRAQAEENRNRVIDVSSRLFREHGFNGIGLTDVMKGAGLTQGGFYKQFASKEDLAAQACARAIAGSTQRWSEMIASEPENPLAGLITSYLSPNHRDAMGEGCAIAALGPDVARAGPAVRSSLEDGIVHHLDVLTDLLPEDLEDRRQQAIGIASSMIGALVLSRIVNDAALSDEILTSAAEDILSRSRN